MQFTLFRIIAKKQQQRLTKIIKPYILIMINKIYVNVIDR